VFFHVVAMVESDEKSDESDYRRKRRHEEHTATEHNTHSTGMQACSYLFPDELTTGDIAV